jgi:hypothetical protein
MPGHLRVFDTFEGEAGRAAHLVGPVAQALGAVGPELLAKDPDLRQIDLLAVK